MTTRCQLELSRPDASLPPTFSRRGTSTELQDIYFSLPGERETERDIHIHNAHVTKEQKYHELTCDNMKRRLYYISTGTVAITCWHFGSMLEMGSD